MTLNKVKYRDFIAPLLVGLIIWLSSPIKPASVSMNAWHILAIFVATTSVLFGSGYVTQGKWWQLNFILGLFYLVVWGGVGALWMKVIGIW